MRKRQGTTLNVQYILVRKFTKNAKVAEMYWDGVDRSNEQLTKRHNHPIILNQYAPNSNTPNFNKNFTDVF